MKIISLSDKHRWNEVIRSMNFHDFYHLNEYHQLDTSGTPFLLYFEKPGVSIAFPLILREIPGTEYFDVTSVYGYPGPLINTEIPNASICSDFGKELGDFFDEHRVITAFSRLNPLFPQQKQILRGLGEVEEKNLTVAIDLSQDETQRKMQYANSLKNQLNRIRRKNVKIEKRKTSADIDTFMDMYYQNMDRLNASSFYYFSSDYFHSLIAHPDVDLVFACWGDQLLAAAICLHCSGIIQFHLSATHPDYLPISPMKYLLDEIATDGSTQGARYLHLGGGFGGVDDTLFEFKSQFSELRFMFKTWKYIHNPEVYEQLIRFKIGEESGDYSFFPLYRM